MRIVSDRNPIAPVLAGAMLAFLLSAAPDTRAQSEPWDAPAFTVEPGVLLRSATAVPVPEGASVLVLLVEHHITFDQKGRASYAIHTLYRIVTPAAVEGWSSVETGWSPWYEEKPEIRARVITADGVEHPLDPKTIGEATASENDPDVYTDRKILRAPLPAVAAGAVVETEEVIKDFAPFFDRGQSLRFFLGRAAPVQRYRVVLQAPSESPLRYRTRKLAESEPRKTEFGGTTQLVFEGGPLAAEGERLPLLPDEGSAGPGIWISTGKSWREVAGRYDEIVEEQIRGADLGALAAGASPKKKGRAVVADLLARLHREVRYTGVEFSEASIVPRPPAETLKRKYGDCKDKSALLVAMLRSAGIPASLALLDTGPGEDIDADLPGLGQFDHAIVYVPRSPQTGEDIWIDATAKFAAAGQLPIADQGRLALIVSPGTDRLLRTPESNSAENRTVETREFFLAENGPARVIEATEAWGSIEQFYRRDFVDLDAAKLKKQMQDYAKSTYLAESPTTQEFSDLRDVSTPFRLRLEIVRARRGSTDLFGAAVAIRASDITDRLPDFFKKEQGDVESGETGGDAVRKPAKRVVDVFLRESFSVEWRYRIKLPFGFQVKQLPDSVTQHMGAALLSKEFAVGADGVVTATLRFDTVKRRYSPAEAEALRKGVTELRSAPVLLLAFESIAESFLAAGKVREALAAQRELVALHPKEGLHHVQLARTLLAAGIGTGAREEVRRAIDLEPSSALAYANLAWILQHDLVGRRFQKGFDWAGAIEAYRKAKSLDPSDATNTVNLAILLEHDANGTRYGRKSKLDDAIAEYKSLGDKLADQNIPFNLPFALLWAHQFEELRELTTTMSNSPTRNSLRMAVFAAADGAAAAVKEASKFISDSEARRAALESAGNLLLQMRYYAQSGDLLAEAAKGSSTAAQLISRAEVIRRVRRIDPDTLPEDDPRTSAIRYFVAEFSTEPLERTVPPLLTREAAEEFLTPDQLEREKSVGRAARNSVVKQGLSTDSIAEISLTAMQLTVDGDADSGFRIKMLTPGASGARNLTFYVVRQDGHLRLLDTSDNPTQVGAEALRRLEAGDLAGARRWLDWVREIRSLGGGDDPLSGTPFARLWTRGVPGDELAIRAAGASLMAASSAEAVLERSIPILLACREKSDKDAVRTSLDLALAQAYRRRRRYGDLLPVAKRLLDSAPTSTTAFQYVTAALLGLKQYAEAEHAVLDRLQRLPDDADAIRTLAHVHGEQRQWDKAESDLKRLVTLGNTAPADWNLLGWLALFRGTVGPEDIENARRATTLTQNNDFASLHTLAALYAEVGKTREAREVLLQAMENAGMDEPNESCWYVFGRLAEQFGENAVAEDEYRKATQKSSEDPSTMSTARLAEQRLAALEAKQKK
jgi:tetratricopeptide (TPR) repeat protein